MSLTKGSGPFGEQPAGAFNFDPHPPKHVLYVEDVPRRVRVLLGDELVADSDEVRLLHPPAGAHTGRGHEERARRSPRQAVSRGHATLPMRRPERARGDGQRAGLFRPVPQSRGSR
ncbi:hypothetical protein BH23ACT9_BH23ACT9_17340 [soil metagenome]